MTGDGKWPLGRDYSTCRQWKRPGFPEPELSSELCLPGQGAQRPRETAPPETPTVTPPTSKAPEDPTLPRPQAPDHPGRESEEPAALPRGKATQEGGTPGGSSSQGTAGSALPHSGPHVGISSPHPGVRELWAEPPLGSWGNPNDLPPPGLGLAPPLSH